jgi:hypothetical protein
MIIPITIQRPLPYNILKNRRKIKKNGTSPDRRISTTPALKL